MAKKTRDKKCSYKDCDRRHYAKGFCRSHYQQNYLHGKLQPLQSDSICNVVGCTEKVGCGRGTMCIKHSDQMKKVAAKKRFDKLCEY